MISSISKLLRPSFYFYCSKGAAADRVYITHSDNYLEPLNRHVLS